MRNNEKPRMRTLETYMIEEVIMLNTLQKMVVRLETMANQNISISHALDVLETNAHTYDELLVINVMRESFNELVSEKDLCQTA